MKFHWFGRRQLPEVHVITESDIANGRARALEAPKVVTQDVTRKVRNIVTKAEEAAVDRCKEGHLTTSYTEVLHSSDSPGDSREFVSAAEILNQRQPNMEFKHEYRTGAWRGETIQARLRQTPIQPDTGIAEGQYESH